MTTPMPITTPMLWVVIVTVLALSSNKVLVNLSMGVSESQAAGARIDDVVRSLRIG